MPFKTLMYSVIILCAVPMSQAVCSIGEDDWISCTGPLPTPDELEAVLNKSVILMFSDCQFTTLTNQTFVGASVERLQSLVLFCRFSNTGTQSLRLEDGALDLFTGIMVLDLSNNNIELRAGGKGDLLCPMAGRLVSLNLKNNRLTDLSPFGFSGTTQPNSTCSHFILKELLLESNHLRSLDRDSFGKLSQLRSLHISNNKLTHVHQNAFQNLNSLRTLKLGSNQLTTLPPTVFSGGAPSLDNLDVTNNSLDDSFYRCLDGLDRLGTLNATGNRLTSVSANLARNLTSLNTLSLEHNSIAAIPDDTFMYDGRATPIYMLATLGHNKLSVITRHTLRGLDNVTMLYLNNNKISKVDENAFSDFHWLEFLQLHGNRLTELPSLHGCTSIKEFDFSDNLIERLAEDQFAHQWRLFSLVLNHNRITRISANHFRNLTNMVSLDLSHNCIAVIEPTTFAGNGQLKRLQLQHNAITTLDGLFSPLRALTSLNLSHNALVRVSWRDHIPLSLTYLSVSHNRIVRLGDNNTDMARHNLLLLDASHNHIQQLDGWTAPSSTQTLNLNHNDIVTMDKLTIHYLLNLRLLSLQHNRVEVPCLLWFVTSRTAEQSPFGRVTVLLAGNPIRCTCESHWMINVNKVEFNVMPIIGDVTDITCRQTLDYMYGQRLPERVTLQEAFDFNLNLCTKKGGPSGRSCSCPENEDEPLCDLSCPARCKCHHDKLGSTVIVDCTATPANQQWTTDMSSMTPNVTVLKLTGTNVSRLGVTSLDRLVALEILLANVTGLAGIDDGAFAANGNLVLLNLESNLLEQLSDGVFVGLTKLHLLNLSKNRLRYVARGTFEKLIALEALLLGGNLLSAHPDWILTPLPDTFPILILGDNPWSCDCDEMEAFRRWIQANGNISFYMPINCAADTSSAQPSITNVLDYNHTECLTLRQLVWASSHQKYIIGASTTAAILLALAVTAVFYFRHEIRVLVYSRYGVRLFHGTDDDGDRDKRYDAFLSYSNSDEQFVVEELLPGLEGRVETASLGSGGYTLCLHQRDFAVGSYISDSIVEAVEQSRRTVVVLSENFVQSEWCLFEFQAAHQQMLRDRRRRLLVILVGKMPLVLGQDIGWYLKTNTYLTWGDKLFWQKLYFAMPERR